ncbi:MAG: type II toxin-antitoxin system HicB family antitoxin [Candidatus Aenigmarchaeota archaeon]|nr:type II toxin-antitoxin system HicB family antitoxin [Candidatus Aenigmarchaeota archaeon]
MRFIAIITAENKMYSSLCHQLDIASSGKTIEEAMSNLKEAIELYLEDPDAVIPYDINPVTLTCIDIELSEQK